MSHDKKRHKESEHHEKMLKHRGHVPKYLREQQKAVVSVPTEIANPGQGGNSIDSAKPILDPFRYQPKQKKKH